MDNNESFVNNVLISVEEWHSRALSSDKPVPVCFTVNGGSMRPLIKRATDRVHLSLPDRKPTIGDIILFPAKRLGGNYVLHRLYKVRNNKFQALGDACLNPDEWLDMSLIYGIAREIEKKRFTIRCDSIFWRAAGRVWLFLFPIRRIIFKLMHILTAILRKIKRLAAK